MDWKEIVCEECPGLKECPTRGYVPIEEQYGGKVYILYTKCKKREKYDKELVYKNVLETSGLPPEYLGKTFENFEIGPNQRAVAQIHTYLQEKKYEKGEGLILVGPTGVGKTHLVAAIIHELAKMEEYVVFLYTADFLDEIRETYDDEYTGEDKFEMVRTATILVLDDLGTERMTDWAKEKITQLLNYRYNNLLPTIVTTNLSLDELRERIGERAFSRLLARSEVLPILGVDRRLRRIGVVSNGYQNSQLST